jgi:prolyl-tRNA synthetase
VVQRRPLGDAHAPVPADDEFLWQEGHTAHATEAEAHEEAIRMLGVYRQFAEDYLAVPVLAGVKTESEKFAGAVRTYCIEALMQDGKALQAGTSHDLGQNFAKAFDEKYQTEKGDWAHVWNTSWGLSTRMVGALVMTHADDEGLVLPPRLAPIQVVLVPIWKGGPEAEEIKTKAAEIGKALKAAGVRFHFDGRENQNPGFKFAEWELAGVPLRLELGPKDLAAGQVMAVRRQALEDAYIAGATGGAVAAPASAAPQPAAGSAAAGGGKAPKPARAKESIAIEALAERIPALLDEIQAGMLARARAWRDARTHKVDSYEDFKKGVETGGFLVAHWCGEAQCEAAIKQETSATIRVILSDAPSEDGSCVRDGKPSKRRVHFAVAY